MSSTKAESKEILSMTVQRRLDGIDFRIISEPLEQAFRLLSDGATTPPGRVAPGAPGWGAVHRYTLAMGANGIPECLAGFNKGRFDLWGSRELVHLRAPTINLSMLLAVGLSTGVTLRVPTVMSNNQLTTYLDGVKAAVRQFYIDYLADRTRTIRITTEEITE